MSGSYPRFIKVLEKWPVDSAKKGKDLGEALRTMFGKTYPQGSVSVVEDEKNLNRQLDALQRLVDNTHLEQNPRTSNSTFTGLEQEVLHQITTTEMMATTSQVAEEAGKQGFWDKLRNTFVRE